MKKLCFAAFFCALVVLFAVGCSECCSEYDVGNNGTGNGGGNNGTGTGNGGGNNGTGNGGGNNGTGNGGGTLPNLGVNGSGNDGDVMTINGIECVLVKAGTFIMGSPESEEGRDDDEVEHQVTLTQDYWISKYEITNAQYGRSGNANHPVVYVTWYEADAFARSIGGRLPTEAEWEFAARGGNKSNGYIYSGSNNLDAVGWYWDNWGEANYSTQPVGQKQPNELGIYDMSGNVWEWCGDWYGSYPTGSVTDPTGPSTGGYRVWRGGSWIDGAQGCRVAYRNLDSPSSSHNDLGFRVVFPRN